MKLNYNNNNNNNKLTWLILQSILYNNDKLAVNLKEKVALKNKTTCNENVKTNLREIVRRGGRE